MRQLEPKELSEGKIGAKNGVGRMPLASAALEEPSNVTLDAIIQVNNFGSLMCYNVRGGNKSYRYQMIFMEFVMLWIVK